MCGRYVSRDQAAIERDFDVRVLDPFEKIFNAAPTMQLPVVRATVAGRVCEQMRWGLIPAWWSKPEAPASTINARSEDAAGKPMWRQAVRHQRCLVPASGWYEWQSAAAEGGKQPYYICSPKGDGLCFAGLWAAHVRDGAERLTFAILTRSAAPAIAHIHNRMPVVLPAGNYDDWLDPAAAFGAVELQKMVEVSLQDFDSYPVSKFVNSPRNQGERCIARLA